VTAPSPGIMLLADLAAALQRHGGLRCNGTVEVSDVNGSVTLTLTVPWQEGHAQVAEFYEDASYVARVAQVRAFAARYGIDEGRLAAFLPQERQHG
jgi:hypothetical protein